MISVQVTGSTAEEVRTALRALAEAFGGSVPVQGFQTNEQGTSVNVELKKPGKARAKDAKVETAEVVEEPAQEPAGEPVSGSPVTNMKPADARNEGIELLKEFFAKDPNNMAKIVELQNKYSVTGFGDIPDARAVEFYADARLTAAGHAEQAAA